MGCADVAMYRAKVAHVPMARYERDFDEVGNRVQLAHELKKAIWQNQLVLHYQSQLDLRTGELTAAEALIRWRHRELGLIPPVKFLPLAEEAGLMGILTRWVVVQALNQCSVWHAEGHKVRVSVNISIGDLLDPVLIGQLRDLLSQHDLPAGAFALEITEHTIIEEFERSREVVASLCELGVDVSIDDFGAGVTSLAYLGGLSVAELKLDRRFIAPLDDACESRDVELVRATIALGHALNLRVVAEGVENPDTIGLLAELGCDYAQGDSIHKPMHPALLRFEPVEIKRAPARLTPVPDRGAAPAKPRKPARQVGKDATPIASSRTQPKADPAAATTGCRPAARPTACARTPRLARAPARARSRRWPRPSPAPAPTNRARRRRSGLSAPTPWPPRALPPAPAPPRA